MIKGRYPLYIALYKAFGMRQFTAKEAYQAQLKNIEGIESDGYVYANMLGEIHRFIEEHRAVKISRGVYELTPRLCDVIRSHTTTPSVPGVVYDANTIADLDKPRRLEYRYPDYADCVRSTRYKAKKPQPKYAYYLTMESGYTYSVSKRELMMWEKDLTEVQREAIRTHKVGKYIGTLNVEIVKVL